VFSLRDYQSEHLDAAIDQMRGGVRRLCMQAPTGSGKTVVFARMAHGAAKKNNRVLILVHRRELLRQTAQKIGQGYGLIAAGTSTNSEPIQIASVQTIVRRLDRYRDAFDLIIIDEAHHATAATYLKIVDANPRARVVGVTATPVRLSGIGLGDLFEALVPCPRTMRELIDDGYLSDYRCFAPPNALDVSRIKTVAGDYSKKSLRESLENNREIYGSAVSHYRSFGDGAPAIAFCASVKHAENTAAEFRAAGYRSIHVDGETKEYIRDRAIADLGAGRIDVLASCDLISEGVDVPVVACGILLRPTKSLTIAMQQIGRILRPAPGKREAIIFDHVHNIARHGLPDADREWSLEHGCKQSCDGAALAVECGQCFGVYAPGRRACPYCGHVRERADRAAEIKRTEGTLQEISKADRERQRRDANRQRLREQGKCQTLDDLVELGRARGYNNPEKWAGYVWESREKRGVGV